MAVVIALVATLIVCVQNYMSVLGFGWALIHGAGLSSSLAFVPAAIGAAVLWAGFVFIRRSKVPRPTLVFTVYAFAIMLLNEALLPATPLSVLWSQRAAEAVEVRNVRDGVLLSARGNPIGIRITLEAIVPRSGRYLIGPSALGRVADEAFGLGFGHSLPAVIDPRPVDDEVYDALREGVIYTFTIDMMPDFLMYEGRAKQPCRTNVATGSVSEAVFLASLAKAKPTKYRGEIHVSTPSPGRTAVVHEFVTTRDYDVEAMYRTIGIEGSRQCGQ